MINKFSLVFLVLLVGSALRLMNLGYSDYQGDEIKAFYNPQEASSMEFFLNQRKGPNQFLITALVKPISDNYENRLVTRLPFALAGVASCYIFYLIAKEMFGARSALISSVFFAANGFLVAFSRIVQYQSFTIMLSLLGVYLYLKHRNTGKYYFMYASSAAFALGFLFHYDAVFFALPVLIWGLHDLLLKHKTKRKNFLKNAIFAGSLFVIITGIFYVPFLLNLTSKTTDYWSGRLTGDVSSKLSSSRYLFSVYQPIYVVHFYTAGTLIASGLIALRMAKGRNRFFSNITVTGIWTLVPFVFMELVVAIPGTHIYTYLIPLILLMGWAGAVLWKYAEEITHAKLVSLSARSGIVLLSAFLLSQSYGVFVDHKVEYPWQEKKFLIWTFPKPTPIFHLSMFGFPYYRNWDSIGAFVNEGSEPYYTSNERVSISRYHVKLTKDGEKIGYFIYIRNPQTFTNEVLNKRAKAWMEQSGPEMRYLSSDGNKVLAEIYKIPQDFSVKGKPETDD